MEQIVLTKIDNAILMNKGNETDISKAKAFTSRYELSQEIDKVFESIKEDDMIYPYDFPNGIHFQIENIAEAPTSLGLRRYAFGDYTVILGINNSGYLGLFYSLRLHVNKKVIDNIDTLTLSFLAEPKI